MGRYIIWEDLVGKYGAIAKGRSATDGAAFIAAAEDEIDARLGNIYSVPFTPVPGVIANLAKDIAYAQMNITNDKIAPPIFKRTDQLLADILGRKVSLQVSGTIFQAIPLVSLSTSGTGTSFGMDDTTRFRVDSNWQQSFGDNRGDPPQS